MEASCVIKAIVLYTLSILKKEEEALPLLKAICDALNRESWYSTQSIAWGLFSYMKFAEIVSGEKAGQATLSLTFNGEKSDQTLQQNKVLLKDLKVKAGTNTLAIVNTF